MQQSHRFPTIAAALILIGACDDATQPTVPTEGPRPTGAVAVAADADAIDAQSLTLPFSGSANTPVLPAFKVVQTGNGSAGHFQVSNGGRSALIAQTNGTSSAGSFLNTNASNPTATLGSQTNGRGAAFEATHTGVGRAAIFRTTDPGTLLPTVEIWNSTWNPALWAKSLGNGAAGYFTGATTAMMLYAENNGSGPALEAYAFGGGEAGVFVNVNASSTRPAVSAHTAGSGPVLTVDRTGSGPLAVFRDHGRTGSGSVRPAGASSMAERRRAARTSPRPSRSKVQSIRMLPAMSSRSRRRRTGA